MKSESTAALLEIRRTIVRPKQRSRPAGLRWASGLLRAVATASPELAASAAFRLWFRTGPRLRPRPEAKNLLAQADSLVLFHRHGSLRGYGWGDGARVLLVHGWGGDSTQLTGFVPPLVAAGYRVMAYDLPAHGRTSGTRTDVFEASGALSEIAREHGPFHAIIAHSFGTLASLLAVRRGFPVDRVVALAPTVTLDTVIRGFSRALDLRPVVTSRLTRRVLEFSGSGFWSDLHLPHPALIVHDRDDDQAPIANAEVLRAAWPESRLMTTAGLGHYRLLRASDVITAVTEFVG